MGGFRVLVGGRVIREEAWRLKKASSLVKLLALTPGHSLHRERVMDLFWPDLGVEAAANNLRQTLYVARRILDPAGGSRYLGLADDRLALCPDGELRVDVDAFLEAAASARRSGESAAYKAAIGLYAGELLPGDRYESWAEERREELRRAYLDLLSELSNLHEERGDLEAAIAALSRAVAGEPADEEAHANLMRLYAAKGQRGQALEQYKRQPEGEPPPEPGTKMHNLPVSSSSFVGRERELVDIKRAVAMTRLLTLTGAGGSGKTRLALAVAHDLVGTYPDGVWFVELAPLSEGSLVPRAAAGALEVREESGRPLVETLIDHLRAKELLLVLDNCEHLLGASACLVEALLGACPRLRVLATSREHLGMAGELGWLVPPLSVPDGSPSVDEIEGYGAARLFAERAAQRSSEFVLTPENAREVADVCRQLDGMPLAIELAAARVGTLSVAQISARLDRSLKLLTDGDRTATPRQRTLRGALDWSHDLLDENEKHLFARLSVFAGGWTLEAAEAVGAGEGLERDDVLDLLSRLVDKSLVVVRIGAAAEARYRLLEPIRQYAREKLGEAGEARPAGRRHAEYFLGLADQGEEALTGPDQLEWLARLETEHDNMRAALEWSLTDGNDAETGLRLAAALSLYWHMRGYSNEGGSWLSKGLSSTGTTADARAKALNGAGYIALFAGEYATAKELLDESLALYRGLGDEQGIAACLIKLGYVAAIGFQNVEDLPAILGEAMALRPRLEDPTTVADLLVLAGLAAVGQGDVKEAESLHEEALAYYRQKGHARGLCMCLTALGLIALGRNEHERASALLRENLGFGRELADMLTVQYSIFGLAGVAVARGLPGRAARLWGAAEALREAAGMNLAPLASTHIVYDRLLAATRDRLGEHAFASEWDAGRAMTREEAVEYALSEEGCPVTLTPREKEVAALVTKGYTNRRISEMFGISERTVATHVLRILKKLGVSSRHGVAARL